MAQYRVSTRRRHRNSDVVVLVIIKAVCTSVLCVTELWSLNNNKGSFTNNLFSFMSSVNTDCLCCCAFKRRLLNYIESLENVPQHVGDVFIIFIWPEFQVIVDCLWVDDLLLMTQDMSHAPKMITGSLRVSCMETTNIYSTIKNMLCADLLSICKFVNADDFTVNVMCWLSHTFMRHCFHFRWTDWRMSWWPSRRSTNPSPRSWSRPSPRCLDTKKPGAKTQK